MWDTADYELAWPKQLFLRELGDLTTHSYRRSWDPRQIELLLYEAFVGEQPSRAFGDYKARQQAFVDELLAHGSELPENGRLRPYWPARRSARQAPMATAVVYRRFTDLIADLLRNGYLETELPQPCPNDADAEVDGTDVLTAQLGQDVAWPLHPEAWDDDTFLGLIEVFHDLVARPRGRRDCRACIGHYWDFSIQTGRALYRWRVNRLLQTANLGLRLADEGEDTGRLVHVVDQARTELIERVLHTSSADIAGPVEHAIALFRGRNATQHDKRSAIIALANVLEDRRNLLKAHLFTEDENALFHIANKFDLRHRNDRQHTEYDPAFRDWVFWWYLSTIELTDRLLAGQAGPEETV